MKKALFILLLLLCLVAWWATRNTAPAPAYAESCSAPAAYPADFQARLARVCRMQLAPAAVLPSGLEWQDARQHPPAGNPAAQKGGTVRLANAGPFPAHFLRFGGSMQFFQQNQLAATEIPLVARHPLSGIPTAGVAEAWAVRDNTFYFKLNPAARYNNGRPVRAQDYLLALLLQAEQGCTEFEQISGMVAAMRCHGEKILSVECHEKTDLVQLCALIHPAEPGFYADFSSRFRETYAQRIPPATGPYRITHVERGRCIRLERVPDWWGESLSLCRFRFNADTLEHHFLTSEAQVWEFFLRGKLDLLQTRNMEAWQTHTEAHPELPICVYDAEYPLPPYGIALNTRTLPDLQLRQGLLHAMNMEQAVEEMMRGEGQRLNTFSSGYGNLTPENTPGYHYSPQEARTCFAQAGFTTPGSDGILRNSAGGKLSVRLSYTPHEKISRVMATLARNAAACGVEILLEPLPWQSCHRQLLEGSHQMTFWAAPAPAIPNPGLFLHPDAAPEMAPFCLNDPVMNTLLQHFDTSSAQALAAIDKRVYELAIWLPGWKENRVFLIHHPRVVVPQSPWCYDAADAHAFWVRSEP